MASFRLSVEAIAILKELARKNGVSQAAVLELSLRRLAEDWDPAPHETTQRGA